MPDETTPAERVLGCDCARCVEVERNASLAMPPRMLVCPTCGNKRCPRATAHWLACTGSNEPGQAGSDYGPEEHRPAPLVSAPAEPTPVVSDERDTTGHEVRHGAAGESVPPVKVLHCPIEHSFYAERRSSRGDRGTCARCGKSKEEHFYDQKADAAPSSPAGNLYARRDIEELGELYVAHVHAMTREGLHAKGDIAAELAHRDARATRAEAERDVARAEVERLRESVRVRDAELLRIRTTQAGAAHQLENVKFALGVRRSEEQTEPAHMVAQRLRGAVEWYAEPRNYLPAAPDTSTDSYANLCSVDGYDATGMPGARARAALAPATPTTEEKGA